MNDAKEKLETMGSDLQNLSQTAENICIDAGAREEAHDLAHRAGTLHKALQALQEDVGELRSELGLEDEMA